MCALEFPDIETSIHQPYKDQGLIVIGIDPASSDTAAILQQFIGQTGVTFPLANALDNSYNQFRASGGDGISPYPLQVLVDGDGIVQYINREFDSTQLQASIEQVLAN